MCHLFKAQCLYAMRYTATVVKLVPRDGDAAERDKREAVG
jgi:hypothetical protein